MRELETELAAIEVDTLLLNIHEEVGAVVAERLDFRFSPTFLVFDPAGREVWRSGLLPTLQDVQRVLPATPH